MTVLYAICFMCMVTSCHAIASRYPGHMPSIERKQPIDTKEKVSAVEKNSELIIDDTVWYCCDEIDRQTQEYFDEFDRLAQEQINL